MRQLVVLSGKGGTGKTSVAAALADLAARECRIVLVDADADAANLALLFPCESVEVRPFRGSDLACIDAELCLACGTCYDACRFDAVVPGDPFTVDETACEGCGACALACPASAIRTGWWAISAAAALNWSRFRGTPSRGFPRIRSAPCAFATSRAAMFARRARSLPTSSMTSTFRT